MNAVRNSSDHATWTAVKILIGVVLLGLLLMVALRRGGPTGGRIDGIELPRLPGR
jgi:hypothetical protein